MICKNNSCKAELPDDATFCLKCGTKQVIPKPNIQNDITETKPNNNDSKKKSLISIITVIVLIACIAVGAVILAPKIIETTTQPPTTVTTVTDADEELVFPLYNCPFVINEIYTSTPNSAGGVDLTIDWENRANSEIKYVYIYVTPYNRVGDIETSEIGGKTTATCRLVGPLNTGDSEISVSENVWYNSDISYAEVDKIELEFTDGITKTYTNML